MDSSSLFLWTAWVYFYHVFKWSVLNNGQLELLLQVVSPKQWTTWVYLHFPKKVSSPASSENEMSLNPSHHYQISFPASSEHGISNIIPRFVGLRNIKFHSPLCRNTEYQISQVSFPVCRMTKCQRCHPQCVWSRDVTDQNVCFYKPSVYKYISNFPIQLSTR